MDFKYNKDDQRRKEILGLSDISNNREIIYFEDIDKNSVKLLIDENFLDPEDAQNCSPTAKDIYDFISNPVGDADYTVSGYIVSPARDDYRTTITSISGFCCDKESLASFVEFARYADELEISTDSNSVYAWWD